MSQEMITARKCEDVEWAAIYCLRGMKNYIINLKKGLLNDANIIDIVEKFYPNGNRPCDMCMKGLVRDRMLYGILSKDKYGNYKLSILRKEQIKV